MHSSSKLLIPYELKLDGTNPALRPLLVFALASRKGESQHVTPRAAHRCRRVSRAIPTALAIVINGGTPN